MSNFQRNAKNRVWIVASQELGKLRRVIDERILLPLLFAVATKFLKFVRETQKWKEFLLSIKFDKKCFPLTFILSLLVNKLEFDKMKLL